MYYFLVKDNPSKFKKISPTILKAYLAATEGKVSKGFKEKRAFLNLCQSFHFLHESLETTYDVPFCKHNSQTLTCPTCKGFKHVGICSHVLAVNHIVGEIDITFLLDKTDKPKKKGGQRAKPRPALQCESSSSEEEVARLT
jgi:hypothetical protein